MSRLLGCLCALSLLTTVADLPLYPQGRLVIEQNYDQNDEPEVKLTFNRKVKYRLGGYFTNVLMIRPAIDKQFVVISTMGASSQAYHLTVYSSASPFRKVIDEVAVPNGLTYAPAIDAKCTIRYRASGRKARVWHWDKQRNTFVAS